MRHLNLLKIGFGLILVCCRTVVSASEQSLPDARVVVAGMLERSANVASADPSPTWTYDKVTVTDQLGDDGTVSSTTEKLHRMTMYRGVPFSRLVKVQGRALSAAELSREEKREAEFRNRISGREPAKVAGRKEPLILKELVDRYQFEVRKREALDGRPTLRVAFSVKSEKQVENNLQDRILNRLAGTIWVDEATFEVARLNVRLTKGLSIGLLGILGSLTECRFSLTRQPMPDGTWLPLSQEAHITARKLASPVHFRVKEKSGNFQAEPVSGSQINSRIRDLNPALP
jgi:hypothetical protein